MLTDKQNLILDFLRKQLRRTGMMPSTREIQHHFRFKSQTAVVSHLKALEKKGVIQRHAGKARGVVLMEQDDSPVRGEVPLYGQIAAGMPSLADNSLEAEEWVQVDRTSLRLPAGSHLFALKVSGDSMIDAHICEGDIVVLELRPPRHGDIVAALIDGETTLKRYLIREGKPFLKPENGSYPELIPAHELVVQGVMVALLRRS